MGIVFSTSRFNAFWYPMMSLNPSPMNMLPAVRNRSCVECATVYVCVFQRWPCLGRWGAFCGIALWSQCVKCVLHVHDMSGWLCLHTYFAFIEPVVGGLQVTVVCGPPIPVSSHAQGYVTRPCRNMCGCCVPQRINTQSVILVYYALLKQ